MVHQGTLVDKLSLAEVTYEPFAAMPSHMVIQVGFAEKTVLANGTLERIDPLVDDIDVPLHTP